MQDDNTARVEIAVATWKQVYDLLPAVFLACDQIQHGIIDVAPGDKRAQQQLVLSSGSTAGNDQASSSSSNVVLRPWLPADYAPHVSGVIQDMAKLREYGEVRPCTTGLGCIGLL